jgi:hypothetical protein
MTTADKMREAIDACSDTILDGNDEGQELQDQRKMLTDNIYALLNTKEEPTVEHIAQVTVALDKDIQLRDFLLGLPSEYSMEDVNNYLGYFWDSVPKEYIAPIASVLASNLYSLERLDDAKEMLATALIAKPNYSLAVLLNRVFNSGWPSGAFVAMTHELHPKVKAGMGI